MCTTMKFAKVNKVYDKRVIITPAVASRHFFSSTVYSISLRTSTPRLLIVYSMIVKFDKVNI